jgi:hypothetical protein
VIHHTQLLAKLVQQGRIKPVTSVEEKLTYHDPCFLGRHSKTVRPSGSSARKTGRSPLIVWISGAGWPGRAG